jgi:DNA repair exonuclease SbcCD nuclease subunit
MSKFTILHTADWHVCDDFLKDAETCLSFLVARAESSDLDLIVISGDIYESRQIRQESNAARLAFKTLQQLARIAPVAIVLGTASHDGRAPLLLGRINERYPIWIADMPESTVLYRCEIGDEIEDPRDPNIFVPLDKIDKVSDSEDVSAIAMVSAMPAFTKQFFQTKSNIEDSDKEIAAEMGAIFAKFGSDCHGLMVNLRHKYKAGPIPHILLGHWQTTGAYVHPDQPMTGLDIEVPKDFLHNANADIICLGHLHAAQELEKYIFYSGSLFPTDFGETETKGFWVHNLDLVDMGHHWEIDGSDFMETPAPHLHKATQDLLRTDDPGLVMPAILGTLSEVTPDENGILRMVVKIYQDMTSAINKAEIDAFVRERISPRKFELDINAMPRPNVRSARVLEEDQLREKLKIRADIINEPIDEDVLRKADALQELERDELLETVQKEVAI